MWHRALWMLSLYMGSKDDLINSYKKSIEDYYTQRNSLGLKHKSKVSLHTCPILLRSQIFGLTFSSNCYTIPAMQWQENILCPHFHTEIFNIRWKPLRLKMVKILLIAFFKCKSDAVVYQLEGTRAEDSIFSIPTLKNAFKIQFTSRAWFPSYFKGLAKS